MEKLSEPSFYVWPHFVQRNWTNHFAGLSDMKKVRGDGKKTAWPVEVLTSRRLGLSSSIFLKTTFNQMRLFYYHLGGYTGWHTETPTNASDLVCERSHVGSTDYRMISKPNEHAHTRADNKVRSDWNWPEYHQNHSPALRITTVKIRPSLLSLYFTDGQLARKLDCHVYRNLLAILIYNKPYEDQRLKYTNWLYKHGHQDKKTTRHPNSSDRLSFESTHDGRASEISAFHVEGRECIYSQRRPTRAPNCSPLLVKEYLIISSLEKISVL